MTVMYEDTMCEMTEKEFEEHMEKLKIANIGSYGILGLVRKDVAQITNRFYDTKEELVNECNRLLRHGFRIFICGVSSLNESRSTNRYLFNLRNKIA